MTYKNSFSDWKTVLRSNLPWDPGEWQSICSADWSSWSDSAGGLLCSFFAELLIHSLVKSARVVFCDCFENEKLTRFPSFFNELVATEITLICVLFALPRAVSANQFGCWRAQVFKVEETRRSTLLPQALGACLWSLQRSLSRALSAREESIPVW